MSRYRLKMYAILVDDVVVTRKDLFNELQMLENKADKMRFEIVQVIERIEGILESNPNTSEFDFYIDLLKELKKKLEDASPTSDGGANEQS